MKSRRWIARIASVLLVLFALGSTFGFILSSLVQNALPPWYYFSGGVNVVENAGESSHEVQVNVSAVPSTLSSSRPMVEYQAIICGTGSFTGYLVLSDDAMLSQPSDSSVGIDPVAGSWNLTIGSGFSETGVSGSDAEAFKIALPETGPCVANNNPTSGPPAQWLGTPFVVWGLLNRPILFSGSYLGIRGPKQAEIWPTIGSFGLFDESPQVLGTFTGTGAVTGSYVRPAVFAAQVFGGIGPDVRVDSSDPGDEGGGGLTWKQWGPISPLAQMTDTAAAANWQNISVLAAVLFGIGGGILATLMLDQVRAWTKDKREQKTGSSATGNLTQPVVSSTEPVTSAAQASPTFVTAPIVNNTLRPAKATTRRSKSVSSRSSFLALRRASRRRARRPD